MFEPFFSTKDRRVGAGLGLAVVQGIIESHGALCRVVSRAGEGTAFSIYFPLSRLSLGEVRPAVDDQQHHGSEGILIVDDEQDIVDVLSLGLERLGYQTLGLDDPVVALAAFEADPAPWEVLVTDQMMPGMAGLELISRIRKIKPGIKTVLCTGYSGELRNGGEDGVDIFLLKPVTARDVAKRIRQLLQSGR
jgi:CheY-like chemotaxis protein